MFAPQYYASPQPMMPGYVQPMQVFHTPDQGQKRELSPLAVAFNENDGKRARAGSTEGSSSNGDESRNISLNDIMAELKKVATKDDIVQIKSTLVAQSAEIQQLRSEIGKHHDRIKSLEDQASVAAAKIANRTQPDVGPVTSKQYGGPHAEASEFRNRRRSIIIHGMNAVKDEDLMEHVLDISQELDVIVFSTDVLEITRLGNPDAHARRPIPVRVTFQHNYMRDKILRNKKTLIGIPKYSTTFINPDETQEARRNKGIFRRIAMKARTDGKEVVYRADWIKIGETVYTVSEINKIPVEYRSSDRGSTLPPRGNPVLPLVQAVGGEPDPDKEAMDIGASANKWSDPNVKIRLTKAGLLFSGPSAFLSNMGRSDFTFENQAYTSVEQGIQHQNAVHHSADELARKILGTDDAKYIKTLSHDIPKTETWKGLAPSKLWDLMDAKYSQNPTLLDKLIDTAPYKLVEASVDSHWGGGAPIESDVYDQGIIPGSNVFGDMETTYRDQQIAKRDLGNTVS